MARRKGTGNSGIHTYHAHRTLSQAVLNSTVERESDAQVIEEDGRYLVISPKFEHRYYIVEQVDGEWRSTCTSAALNERCIEMVHQYQRVEQVLAETTQLLQEVDQERTAMRAGLAIAA